jgi:hypothetical protein
MKLITDYFESLKSEFSKFIITYDYYKVDIYDPENVHILNLNDSTIELEGFRFHLNGNDLIGFYFSNLVNQVQGEIVSNYKMPIAHDAKVAYLNDVIEYSLKLDESIIKSKGKWTFQEGIYDGFIFDELQDYKKEFLSNSIKGFKMTFRNLIAFVIGLKESLKPLGQNSINGRTPTYPILQKDPAQDLTREILTKTFKWKRKEEFNRDLLILFELMTNDKYRIIPKDTGFNTFCYAFSGRILNCPLRIKWLVTGKNKLTSKSSLFHFISRLEDNELIEVKEWNQNDYGALYQKISSIFSDKDGNPFSIEGLKSSRSQGVDAVCAMQNKIDQIVLTIVNSNRVNLQE